MNPFDGAGFFLLFWLCSYLAAKIILHARREKGKHGA